MTHSEIEAWRDGSNWDPTRGSVLDLQIDLAEASWIEPQLAPGSFEVRMTAPQGFDAYARILFPFEGSATVVGGLVHQEVLSWSELARRNGRIIHPMVESETIMEKAGKSIAPFTVSHRIADGQVDALTRILANYTKSAVGWFLLWDGFGDLDERAFVSEVPKVIHATRSYYLFRGPLAAYCHFPHDPNYWWPEDRAWCLSTDIDFDWAYLAGPTSCVADVLAEPVLDAIATRPEYPARAGMDVLNGPNADGLQVK